MKNLSINFRDPAADRFIEILAVAEKFGLNPKIHILNLPEGYMPFVREFLPNFFMINFEDCDFCLEYPPNVNFNTLFAGERMEPIDAIKERIEQVKETESKGISSAGMAILKNAVGKLQLNKDRIQEIIYLGYIISQMDHSSEVKAEHIAEAIQYCKEVSE